MAKTYEAVIVFAIGTMALWVDGAELRGGETAGVSVQRPSGGARTLSFPDEEWIGTVEIEPEAGLVWDAKGVRLPGAWPDRTAAHGEVLVPRDRNVRLRVTLALSAREEARLQKEIPRAHQQLIADSVRERARDLSALSALDPNDLFWLEVGSPMYRRTGADPAILEPIGRLTGLKILSLHSAGVTNAGLEPIRALRSLEALELAQFGIGTHGLAVLKNLPVLEYLSLNTAVTDAGLKEIAGVSSLRWLNLIQGRFYGPGLAELAKLPHLERLCIQGDIFDRQVQYLEGLTHLKGLTFWYAGDALTDASLASIAKLASLEELHFAMSSPKFTPAGVAHLKKLEHLKELDFGAYTWGPGRGEQYGDEVARQLADMPGLESIRRVSYLSDEGVKALSTLKHLKCLDIRLKDTRQGYRGPTGLAYLSSLQMLETLHIGSGDPLADEDLAALESLSGLKTLLIHGSGDPGRGISDRGMASIGKLKQLECLTLMTHVTRNSLNHLNGLSKLQQLQVSVLSLAKPEEMSHADESTLNLSGLKRLTDLSLTGIPLYDDDLAFIQHLSSLERAEIDPRTPLTGESLRHFRDLPKLSYLLLSGFSSPSSEDLSHLNSLPELRFLRATGNITDAALASLEPPRLDALELNTNAPISKQTVEDLTARMPAIEYIHIAEPFPRLTQRAAP